MRSGFVKKFLLAGAILLTLSLFNLSRARYSAHYADYENWLALKEAEAAGGKPPHLTLRVGSLRAGVLEWEWRVNSEEFDSEKFFRMLRLFGDSGVFLADRPPEEDTQWSVVIQIEDGSRSFIAEVPPKALESNITALTALALLREYMQPAASVPREG